MADNCTEDHQTVGHKHQMYCTDKAPACHSTDKLANHDHTSHVGTTEKPVLAGCNSVKLDRKNVFESMSQYNQEVTVSSDNNLSDEHSNMSTGQLSGLATSPVIRSISVPLPSNAKPELQVTGPRSESTASAVSSSANVTESHCGTSKSYKMDCLPHATMPLLKANQAIAVTMAASQGGELGPPANFYTIEGVSRIKHTEIKTEAISTTTSSHAGLYHSNTENQFLLSPKTITASQDVFKTLVNTSPQYGTPSGGQFRKPGLLMLIPETVLEQESDNEEVVKEETKRNQEKDAHHTSSSPDLHQKAVDLQRKDNISLSADKQMTVPDYESDMDYSSDTGDRLVISNDIPSEDNGCDDNSSDDEEGVASSQPLTSVTVENISNHSEKSISSLPAAVSKLATISVVKESTISLPLSVKSVSNTASYPVKVIPSVVSDISSTSDHVSEQSPPHIYGKKHETKSLPANGILGSKNAADISLLKMNKPAIPCKSLPLPETKLQFSVACGTVYDTKPAQLPVTSKQVNMPDIKHRTQDTCISVHSALVPENTRGDLLLQLAGTDAPDRREKLEKHKIESEGRSKKEKSLASLDSPDVSKDSTTSEEQVNVVINKYKLWDSPEKREVSVKDMRRVIPLLIMLMYSKEDHHARKVKGLWEKKPDNWPSDIPYCDPNNSNRGGDSTGKPKKETLQKMFEFLINQYLQKLHREEHHPLPSPAKSAHLEKFSQHGILLGKASLAQPPPSFSGAYTSHCGSTINMPDGNITGLNTSNVHYTGSKEHEMKVGLSDGNMTPPIKRQKIISGEVNEPNLKSNANCMPHHHPAVVSMFSPTYSHREDTSNHIHDYMFSKSSAHLGPHPNTTNMLESYSMSGEHKNRYSSIPLLMSNSLLSSDDQMNIPKTVTKASHTQPPVTHVSCPQSLQFSPHIILTSHPPQLLTTQTVSSMPIIQNITTQLGSQQPHQHIEPLITVPVCHEGSPKCSSLPEPNLLISSPRKSGSPVPGDISSHPTCSTQTLEGTTVCTSSESSSTQPSVGIKHITPKLENSELKQTDQINCPTEPKQNEHMSYKRESQVPSDDFVAASAILMLSTRYRENASCAGSSIQETNQIKMKKNTTCEEKTECLSVESDRDSLAYTSQTVADVHQCSSTCVDPKQLPLVTSDAENVHVTRDQMISNSNKQTTAPGDSLKSILLPVTPCSSSASPIQEKGFVHTPHDDVMLLPTTGPTTVTVPDQIYTTSKISTNNAAMMSKYSPSSLLFPVTSVSSLQCLHELPAIPNSTKICSSSASNSGDKLKNKQPSPVPVSDTSSESSTCQTPKEYISDHPLSLVLPRHNTDEKEHPIKEIASDESVDPVLEIMKRIQLKLSKIEELHSAKLFREKDLSLLLLVLDLLKQKQNSLEKKCTVEFILTCHKLEATFDVALVQKCIPDKLREYWRDYQEKNYFEVNRRRSNVVPPTDAPVFRLSTTQ